MESDDGSTSGDSQNSCLYRTEKYLCATPGQRYVFLYLSRLLR